MPLPEMAECVARVPPTNDEISLELPATVESLADAARHTAPLPLAADVPFERSQPKYTFLLSGLPE